MVSVVNIGENVYELTKLILVIHAVDNIYIGSYLESSIKQAGWQNEDEFYSHNDIPGLVRKKLIAPRELERCLCDFLQRQTRDFHVSCTTQTFQTATILPSRKAFNQKSFAFSILKLY
jgi:hypothetical protein